MICQVCSKFNTPPGIFFPKQFSPKQGRNTHAHTTEEQVHSIEEIYSQDLPVDASLHYTRYLVGVSHHPRPLSRKSAWKFSWQGMMYYQVSNTHILSCLVFGTTKTGSQKRRDTSNQGPLSLSRFSSLFPKIILNGFPYNTYVHVPKMKNPLAGSINVDTAVATGSTFLCQYIYLKNKKPQMWDCFCVFLKSSLQVSHVWYFQYNIN